MTAKNPADERLRGLLGGLSPAARALIAKGIRARPGSDSAPTERPAAPALAPTAEADLRQALGRAFFEPIAAFVNAPQLLHREHGRLAEDAVELVWQWICRDLAAAALDATLSMRPSAAELPGAAADLREAVLPMIASLLGSIGDAPIAQQRLSAQIGGDRSYRDLAAIDAAFRQVGWVMPVMRRMPRQLTRRELEEDPGLLAPVEAALISPRGEPVWLFSALLPQLESPTLLARIVVMLAGTDETDAIARSPLASAMDIVLSEVEIEVARLRDARADRRPGGAGLAAAELAIQRYHAMLRELEALLDLAASPWGTRVALIKKVATAEVEPEIGEAGGYTRRVFRQKSGGGDPLAIDGDLVDDADRALHFLKAAANARESFALNAVVASVGREVEMAFEVLVDPLLNELRTAYGEAKQRAAARAEAALRLAETYYGSTYAATLRRSVNSAAEERSRLRG